MENVIKKGLLILVFFALSVPFVIKCFTDTKFYQLKGAYTSPSNATFSKSDWIEGLYQEKKEAYLNAEFSLRDLFVRLNNQIAFSLFSKAKANGVIIGKENYLYEKSYIDAYFGRDYIGNDSILHIADKLKYVSDTLRKLNKQIIVVLAPGKASFYPEYIPDNLVSHKETTNYDGLSAGFKKNNINVIDFYKWFNANRATSKYPLYSKQGVHWSTYGVALAGDSLIKYIEYIRNIDLPDFSIDKVLVDNAYGDDIDIYEGMNILSNIEGFKMGYPQMKASDTNGKTKPKVLVIADSYYWGMSNMGISTCFENGHFWYYNKQVYPESATKETLTETQDFKTVVDNNDVMIILSTEANLKNIGWGFIDRAYYHFKGQTVRLYSQEYLERVKKMVEYIRNDPQWFKDAKKRSEGKTISLDSCLVLEAMWFIDNEGK